MIKTNERLPVIDVEDDAGDPTVPQEINPLLTPDVLARRVRVGKALREEHIKRTVKTPGARRRQLRFKLFTTVSRDPLSRANEQATLYALIAKFREHAGDQPHPNDGYTMPNEVINMAMASFYCRVIIGKRARAQNPKLPPWPPSEAELDAAETYRRDQHPMDRTIGLKQWLRTVAANRSISDLCKEAFGGG